MYAPVKGRMHPQKKRDEKTKGKREHRLEEVTRFGML